MAQSFGARGDALNLWALRVTRQPLFEDARTVMEVLGPGPTRELVLVYFRSRRRAWSLLVTGTGLFAVGLAFAASRISVTTGYTTVVALGFFPVGFCLGAELDAVWRYYYAKWATQQTPGDVGSPAAEQMARLSGVVRGNYASVFLPLVGGFVAAGLILGYS